MIKMLKHSLLYKDAVYCYRRSSIVCRSVCRSVTIVSPAKTAEPIEMSFGVDSREPSEPCTCIRWFPDFPYEGAA